MFSLLSHPLPVPSVSQDLYKICSHLVAWLQVIEDTKVLVAQGRPSKAIEKLDEQSLHAAEMVSAWGLAVNMAAPRGNRAAM